MINWKQNKREQNKTKTQTRKCRVQRTLYLQVTLHRQQSYGFWLEARSISGYVVRVFVFIFNILLPPLALNNQSFPIYHYIHCIAPLYLLTVLTATRHYSSIDPFSFLFSQFRPREFAFCLLINHAFHIQVNSRAKDDIWKKRLWSWMGKHNIQAKKSVKLDTIPSLYFTKPMFLLQTLTNAVQRSLRADGGLFVLTHLEVTRVIVGRAIGANNVMSVSIPCT